MSNLAIKIDGKYAVLKPDTSIDLTLTNPFFNDTVESISLPFTLPTDGNGVILGNAEVIESDDNLRSLEKKVMEVEIEGIVFSSGKVGNIEDQRIQGEVGLQMVSAVYSLDDYLDGVRCRDVELIDKIPIGETIGNITVNYSCDVNTVVRIKFQAERGTVYANHVLQSAPVNDTIPLTAQLPALGFSRPERCTEKGGPAFGSMFDSDGGDGKEPSVEQSYINVVDPYPIKKYHNARISYMHHKLDKDETSSDEVDTEIDNDDPDKYYNPYYVLDANRPASGICFYVLYFLDCLFARFRKDGIVYDNSELVQIDDMCRLSFFTTHCKFSTEQIYAGNGVYKSLRSLDEINSWLHTRNIDTKIEFRSDEKELPLDHIIIDGKIYRKGDKVPFRFGVYEPYSTEFERMFYRRSSISNAVTADVMTMLASSQNFPDADAKDVLDSLWSSFGIRFHIDQHTRIVKPVFIRDILTDTREPVPFLGITVTAVKSVEKITGFRMQYSGQGDKQQRQDNITLGVLDYDTTYDYEDYRNIDITKEYAGIIPMAYDTNDTCYVDMSTGNLYRVKIDGEADERKYYHPVIFEVGQLCGVEIGDCSDDNKEFVHEVTSSFQPLIPNDVNFRFEKSSIGIGQYVMRDDGGLSYTISMEDETDRHQKFAAFISTDMWHENIERRISYPVGNEKVDATLDMNIKTRESYDVASSKDGDSPLQSLDWGLAVTIMRGGGYDAGLDIYDGGWDMLEGMRRPDLFGNSKYRIKSTSNYAASYDSIDCYGISYDYNGSLPGVDDNGSVLTAALAAKTINGAFPLTNANLLSPSRKVSVEAVRAKGWTVSGTYCTYLSGSSSITDLDGHAYEFLYTVIKDDGTILSPDELRIYLDFLVTFAGERNVSVMTVDADFYRLIIGRYENVSEADLYAELLHQLGEIYYGDEDTGRLTCTIPSGVIVYYPWTTDHFSLKIRSYIEAPRDLIDKNGNVIKVGTPLCDPSVARRGLFDTFMSEYAHFILHRKKVVLQVHCHVSALVGIDWSRRYRFGDYIGWINSIHVQASVQNGIDLCEVELYVL